MRCRNHDKGDNISGFVSLLLGAEAAFGEILAVAHVLIVYFVRLTLYYYLFLLSNICTKLNDVTIILE